MVCPALGIHDVQVRHVHVCARIVCGAAAFGLACTARPLTCSPQGIAVNALWPKTLIGTSALLAISSG